MKVNLALELRKQLNFIVTSCRAYDEGRYEEALRIAVAARVLFHQTQHSNALFGGHHPTDALKIVSTTMFSIHDSPTARHILGFIGLCPSAGGFRPCLADTKRKEEIPLRVWWSEEPIMALLNESGETVTRRQLILASANRDGGAHIDEKKPGEYERLQDGLSIEVVARFHDGATRKVKLRHANLAALRQIGHEILVSPYLVEIANRSTPIA